MLDPGKKNLIFQVKKLQKNKVTVSQVRSWKKLNFEAGVFRFRNFKAFGEDIAELHLIINMTPFGRILKIYKYLIQRKKTQHLFLRRKTPSHKIVASK